ncbi:MAG TPA: phosphoribosylglycinamide formyltransferase [Actinomycetota bacterium]|nr:phosphoribosylglycinamide formyltransferase [Actinomycetota bacterium]
MIPPRVAVLASGYGTNLQALLDDPVTRPWIALVVSDRDSAVALARAEAHGVATAIVDPARSVDRRSFDAELLRVLREADAGFVVLAGYLRVLGPEVVRAYEGKILNVHPSLLPAFPGASSVADALDWGAKVTGVTVHLVDEELDHGPILAQEAIGIADDDDWDSLEARVHAVEHRLLPAALRALVDGRVRVEGRRVRVVEVEGG